MNALGPAAHVVIPYIECMYGNHKCDKVCKPLSILLCRDLCVSIDVRATGIRHSESKYLSVSRLGWSYFSEVKDSEVVHRWSRMYN